MAALFGTRRPPHQGIPHLRPLGGPRPGGGRNGASVYDASIVLNHPGGLNRANSSTRHLYHVEMNSPVLEYSEMGKLQAVVRALRGPGQW